jgi:hypothetical protein
MYTSIIGVFTQAFFPPHTQAHAAMLLGSPVSSAVQQQGQQRPSLCHLPFRIPQQLASTRCPQALNPQGGDALPASLSASSLRVQVVSSYMVHAEVMVHAVRHSPTTTGRHRSLRGALLLLSNLISVQLHCSLLHALSRSAISIKTDSYPKRNCR